MVTDADLAIEQLYLEHWHHLVRLSVLLVRDPGQAEEIAQDAFVELHRRWGRLDEAPDLVVPFKRKAYEQVVAAFAALVV